MSSNHVLQGKIKGPRESTVDQRIAKTHETHRSVGKDGKLYNKVDEADYGKYHVLDEEGVEVEKRRSSELKRSIQITKGGSKLDRDGLAKTVTVGTASHTTKISTHQQTFPASHGAESKNIETVRKGDVGVISGSSRRAESKGNYPSSPTSHGYKKGSGSVRISTNTHTLSPQSKAYTRNLEGIAAEMRAAEDKNGPSIKPPSAGDEDMPPAPGDAQSPSHGIIKPKCNIKSNTHKVLSKAEALVLHEQKIALEKLERERYEAEQTARFHRASMNGKEFTKMMRRAEEHHEKVTAKSELKREQEKKKNREEAEARTRKRKEHLSKELNPPGELSWREMQEQAEISRKESAEKRKQEMAASSKAPAAGSAHNDQEKEMRAAARRAEYDAANNFSFKAEDPDKVAAKLARADAAWQRKVTEKEEQTRQRMIARELSLAGKPTKSPLAGMEERAANAATRRAARQAQREERLAAAAAKKAEVERKKTEKLYNTKVPEEGRRLTKAAMYRSQVVKDNFEKKLVAERKEQKLNADREKKEREMSYMLSSQISSWEKDRREKMPGYRELSEAELEQNRREAKLNFKANLKRNQERLQEVLADRPSLLERHSQNMAAKTAAASALTKVAQAVRNGHSKNNTSTDYDNDDFDFFNDEEKIKLSVAGVAN